MNKIVVYISIFIFSILFGSAQENTFIPQPENVVFTSGGFNLNSQTQVYIPSKYNSDLHPIVATKLLNDTGLSLFINKGKAKVKSNYILFQRVKDVAIDAEGYKLEVSSDKIIIKAKDYAGMFNGFQTLRQAIPVETKTSTVIPNMKITDNPRFHWRGVLLDVSRHFHSKEFVMKPNRCFVGL